MTKVNKIYSINQKIADEFDEKTPSRKTSQTIEKLMRKYLDKDEHQATQETLLKNTDLTNKQKKLVVYMIANKVGETSLASLTKQLRSEGIYSSKQQIKKGVKAVCNNPSVPFKIDNRKVVPTKIICGCDASNYPGLLVENDGKCLSCDARIFAEENMTMESNGLKVEK